MPPLLQQLGGSSSFQEQQPGAVPLPPGTDPNATLGGWWAANGFGGNTGVTGGGAPSSGNPTDRDYVRSQIAQVMQQNGVTPGARGSGPSDLEYYTDQAMATGGWTPDNAGYWQGRLTSDIRGGGGQGGAAGQAMSTNPGYGIFQNLAGGMSPDQILKADPGYQFALQQGQDAIQRSAAARGTLLTGGTLKGLAGYTAGAAAQDYGNIFNRQLALGQFGSGLQNQAFGQNFNLAQLGANAANAQGNLASSYGNQLVNLQTGQGNAQAAGTIGSANAWGQGIGGVTNALGGLPWNTIFRPSSGATPPFVGSAQPGQPNYDWQTSGIG